MRRRYSRYWCVDAIEGGEEGVRGGQRQGQGQGQEEGMGGVLGTIFGRVMWGSIFFRFWIGLFFCFSFIDSSKEGLTVI